MPSKKHANQEYANARQELERVSKEDRVETPRVLAANDRVARAAENVSWWRR